MKILCILPSAYSERSNGIATLCLIYQALQRSASLQTICICKRGRDSDLDRYKVMYGNSLKTYSDQDKDNLSKTLCGEPFVLVRPDDLEGINNEIHWDLSRSNCLHLIVNILLAPPFAFASKIPILKYYDKKDTFLLANQATMPAFAGMEELDLFTETNLDSSIWDFVNHNNVEDRKIISVYIGKGIARQLSMPTFEALGIRKGDIDSQKFVLIKRKWPASREQLYSVIASSRMLISYDPFSHIERVSTFLGTPVLKLCQYNLRELPGVFVTSDPSLSDLKCIPEPIEIHRQSAKDYQNNLLKSRGSLGKIVSTILKVSSDTPASEQLVAPLIPFSRRCLLAFGSQLRGLLPKLGAMSMAHYNESLNETDLMELINPSGVIGALSPRAHSYSVKVGEYLGVRPRRDPSGINQIYYQYKKRNATARQDQIFALPSPLD